MVAALQNLVKIMGLYYQYMEAYMGPALFAVSSYFPSSNMHHGDSIDHIRSHEVTN